ncbi:DegT/DnrJ/EryC1/StrS family aminotransferase [Pseudoflavitalea sp. X16]|uniref:DegT/DnrJ/EryC1/StrS family aminotransferase n=1 Tax=Paraflavitalea devenefica TaxID=2716334 RepID=UPI00142484E4|nr:DegT/DnrJ/EryC1/StrS family aminotransferase [Paraflavitalea devenefica]NII28461.1 DegT/DnrJ/EryC1/StrS family aminotransferase [Paraflavitalea devenefica]
MSHTSRRKFIRNGSLGTAGVLLSSGLLNNSLATSLNTSTAKPAILGGMPTFNPTDWVKWPVWLQGEDEQRFLDSVRSGVWSRNKIVTEFETTWAAMLGSKKCLTVVNGTNALITVMNRLDIGPGDEVITTPYTFIASIQAILANNAMPVFADIDPLTFQIDATKIERLITKRTKAILAVHILGLPADMDNIMRIAQKHNLLVIEDACQAHLAEYDHKKAGTIGKAGCFSFQNSKNLPIGEGGAIVSDDEKLIDQCYAAHNLGYGNATSTGSIAAESSMKAGKVRLTEYQAAIGLAQLKRLEAQTATRNSNAQYLTSMLKDIKGITPIKLNDKVTQGAWHLYAFRYNQEAFKGLARQSFIKALAAEGLPCSGGYKVMHTQEFMRDAFNSRVYKGFYTKDLLDFNKYRERSKCPENALLCNEAVWIPQNVLLGTKEEMEKIAAVIKNISNNADKIKH